MKIFFAALLFIFLFRLIPFLTQKFKIKDNIKHTKTLPIGTGQFKVFLKVIGGLILFIFILGLILNL